MVVEWFEARINFFFSSHAQTGNVTETPPPLPRGGVLETVSRSPIVVAPSAGKGPYLRKARLIIHEIYQHMYNKYRTRLYCNIVPRDMQP